MHEEDAAAQVVSYLTETRHGWPSGEFIGRDGTPRVTFTPTFNDGDKPALAIIRSVEIGGIAVAVAPVWAASYETMADAQLRWETLTRNDGRCSELGRAAAVFGLDQVTATIETGIRIEEANREGRRRQVEQIDRIAREMAEESRRKARVITCYFKEPKGRFVVELTRGNTHQPFWSLSLVEKWERDRFWDWLRWQKDRWPDFADFLTTGEGIDLERMLLKEMLETEKRVKKAGLGAGGRRPLRFWRGEA